MESVSETLNTQTCDQWTNLCLEFTVVDKTANAKSLFAANETIFIAACASNLELFIIGNYY